MIESVNTMISIIVPVYNVFPYIDRCIESLVNQTYDNFQLFLIDDGSSDGCSSKCDEYAKKYLNVFVIHGTNGGLSVARNRGIDFTLICGESKWITFVDSDDYVTPTYLYELINTSTVKKTMCSICGFSITRDSELHLKENTVDTIVLSPDDAYEYSFPVPVNLTQSCAKLFHISLFDNVRFPVGKLHEDRFTTYRLLFQCNSIAIRTVISYMYYQREDSISRTAWTPKRLDTTEASIEQLNYFRENGFEKAYHRTILDCIYNLNSFYDELKRNNTIFLPLVRDKLNYVVKTYALPEGINFENYPFLFRHYSPLRFFIFKLNNSVSNTLRIILRKNCF